MTEKKIVKCAKKMQQQSSYYSDGAHFLYPYLMLLTTLIFRLFQEAEYDALMFGLKLHHILAIIRQLILFQTV